MRRWPRLRRFAQRIEQSDDDSRTVDVSGAQWSDTEEHVGGRAAVGGDLGTRFEVSGVRESGGIARTRGEHDAVTGGDKAGHLARNDGNATLPERVSRWMRTNMPIEG